MDLKFIRQNKQLVIDGCRKKRVKVDIDKIITLDEGRRELMGRIENLRAEQNKMGKKPSPEEINRLKQTKTDLKSAEEELEKIEPELMYLVHLVPNMPLSEVIEGQSEADNVVLREVGQKPRFSFTPKDYLALNEKLDLIDTERAAKVAGSRFGYLKNEAVLLEFALMQLALEVITKNDFIPVLPPVMVNEKAMSAMGYLDRSGDEIYKTQDDLYLVGTSEQSVGPMHMDEIFAYNPPAGGLPRRYVSFSTCFRREAGSYGKDVKGIIRVHQFDKMEMFVFCRPEDSTKEHQLLLSLEEKLMQLLKIPYRVLDICTADLGDPAAAKYDLEAWMPGQNQYRETHSTSNCTDFQAQRLNVRFRDQDGKINFVHTLNGTAFAVGRLLIAIIENYQQKDGSIMVPKVLQKYIRIKKINIKK